MSNKQKIEEKRQGSELATSVVKPELPENGKLKTENGKVPWSPWAAVLYAVLVYFTAQFLAGLIVYAYPLLRGWSVERSSSWLSVSVVAQFLFVLLAEVLTFWAIWWFIKRRSSSLRAIGWKRPRWTDPLIAVGGFVAYLLVYVVVLYVATHLFTSLNVNQKQELGFDDVAGNANLILTFISLVVLPPIVEETVFRGFVYTGMRNKFKPIWAAVFTSVLFAIAHLQFGNGKPLLWVAAIDTFTLSLVLCYLREKTGSLWPGIFLHALKNGIAFASLYLVHLL